MARDTLTGPAPMEVKGKGKGKEKKGGARQMECIKCMGTQTLEMHRHIARPCQLSHEALGE